MNTITDILNNREMAIILCLLIFLIWVLTFKDIRSSIYSFLRILFQKLFIIALSAMSIYVGLILLLYFYLHLWDLTMVKETIYWFFGTALVLSFNVNNANDDEDYFKKILLNNVKFILILEFIISLYVFSFWFEMILIPSIIIFATMSAVAETQKKFALVKKVLDFILAVYGIGLAVFAIINITSGYSYLFTSINFVTFLLPPLLTIAFLPFIYFFALYISYESLFVRLDIFIKEDKLLARFAKLKLFQLCFLRLKKLQKIKKENFIDFLYVKEKEDVLDIILKIRRGKS